MTVDSHIPLALYIHMPWCVKKCPYCDFNSHAVPQGTFSVDGTLSISLEQEYLAALLADAKQQVAWAQNRPLVSVFIGGGTPSLISAAGYQWLFAELRQIFEFAADCEITLEANPGTLEHAPFSEYLIAGINRLSLGVQTFNDELLHMLGRVHGSDEARLAIERACADGFDRLNVDLMHGLPNQTVEMALFDLQNAMDCGATHISWYQLTIEPNTVFFRTQPVLPDENRLADIQSAGEALLRAHGYVQYEVSAWAKELPSRHNLNYWQFGDYLAIGAGAHGKITVKEQGSPAPMIYRFQKSRLPKDYLAQVPAPPLQFEPVLAEDLPFEFMMNALRLVGGVPQSYFAERTGLSLDRIGPTVRALQQEQLMQPNASQLVCTALGFNYLNVVLERFSMSDD
ncbi:radical SAM family heme chaperone HemW [Aquirhabdus sp.]|uniref:radical SAM family heme chaperone HemW n=1 Tax=Aquirhabdus sp. TaxID=2824160 RepID=UPI00396C31D5